LHHERTLGEVGAENNENFNDQAARHSLRKCTVNRLLLFDQVRDMVDFWNKAVSITQLTNLETEEHHAQYTLPSEEQSVQLVNLPVEGQHFDNYFNSPDLQIAPAGRGILSLGTVRMNRVINCNVISDAELRKRGRGSYAEKVSTVDGISLSLVR
jgi:hypothetical protein